MFDKDLMDRIGIDFDRLILFYNFCVRRDINISFDTFIMKYFPYIIAPSAKQRLIFLEANIVEGKILDAGCGSGWVSFWLILNNNRADVELGDFSDRSLNETNVLHSYFDIKNEPKKFDLTDLPYPSETFDTVICFSVLEHIPSLHSAVDELRRVLRPKGRLIVAIPNKTGSYSLINDTFGPSVLSFIGKPIYRGIEGKHEHLHGFQWWKQSIEENGFILVDSMNIELLTSFFTLMARTLHINRYKLYSLALLDDLVAKHMPKFMASDWMMAFEKK